nr:hypothetical protein [Tanacetum cinerariifolium]
CAGRGRRARRDADNPAIAEVRAGVVAVNGATSRRRAQVHPEHQRRNALAGGSNQHRAAGGPAARGAIGGRRVVQNLGAVDRQLG